LAITPNRHIAGIMEIWLKQFYSDKTNWRQMLLNETCSIDLAAEKIHAINHLTSELKKHVTTESDITEIQYPVIKYPEKVKSISFDNTPVIEEIITGIKGQYLIFNSNNVLNIRKHSGYFLHVEV
jgi:hypothetical protein